MGLVSGAVLYVIIWTAVIFTVLPWGVRVPDRPERGHATSAPERPRILLKLVVTTVLSAVLWGLAYLLIQSDLIPLDDLTGGAL